MRAVDGFALFLADPPHVGLDPHPAFGPNAPKELTAEGWALAYHMVETLSEAEAEAADDHEETLASVESGDLEDVGDPDVALAVRVFENGDMAVFADSQRTVQIAYHAKEAVFEAYSMDFPRPLLA